MTTIEDVVAYIFHTPDNINPSILRQLLNDLIDSGGGKIIIDPEALEVASQYAGYFAANVYNKKGTGQSLNRENDNDVATKYYVRVATEVTEDVRVRIDNKRITSNDTMKLSVGNNSFVNDVYYYVDDDALYIAFPMLLFELVEVNDVIVSKPEDLDELKITGTKIVGEGEVIPNGNKKYIANIRKRNSYIDLGLEGVQTNEMVLSKKIYNGKLTYGFIKADEVVDNVPGIGYYPFAWATNEQAWIDMPDVATTIYTLFAIENNAITTVEIEARKNGAIEDEVIYDGGGVEGN